MAIVYKHIRKDTNDVFYIGIGKTVKRAHDLRGRNSFWYKISRKTEFVVEIIEDGLSWEDACEREKYWIKYYGRRDLNEGTLVNLTDGGDGTANVSKEVTDRISSKAKERYKDPLNHPLYGKSQSISAKQKIGSKARKRLADKTNHPMYGRHHTDETISKIIKTQITNKLNKGDKNPRWVGYINKELLGESIKNSNNFRDVMKIFNRSQKVIQRNIKYHYGDITFKILKLCLKIPKNILLELITNHSNRYICSHYHISNNTLKKIYKYHFNTELKRKIYEKK